MVRFVIVWLLLMVCAPGAQAEEGMWTFDNFPIAKVNKAYGLRLDQAWVNRIRDTSVRLNVGCSGGIVSAQGLVFTNQHCVMSCAQDLSSAEHDLVADGFLAGRREDEVRCEGMAAEILTGVSDVTLKIRKASKGLAGNAYVQAISAKSSEIEQAACGDDIKRRCQVVSLYQGGQYKLYQFRKYSDVRLVFVPEFQTAFFGGDPDNFNFPRYALDVAFVRLYEDGKVVDTPNYLKWQDKAPKEGEPIFAPGNPGKTERTLTAAQLESQRDIYLPMTQAMRSELRGRLIAFAEQSPENKRISAEPLFEVENSFKAMYGQEMALRDPDVFAAKRREEGVLKRRFLAGSRRVLGDPWTDLGRIQTDYGRLFAPYFVMEQSLSQSTLFMYARLLVRAAAEREKPSAQRQPEYSDSRLSWVKYELLTPMTINKPVEALLLNFRLSKAREYLRTDPADVALLLGKASPEGLAKGLVDGTRLNELSERQRLWDGGMAAIMASDDPMIQYALRIDAASRAVRMDYEAKVVGPSKIASEKIAKVRFAAYGTSTYPDATWTPRLSYGRVKGWVENGATVKPFTTYAGLFARATGEDPYRLPARFAAAQGQVDGDVVLNFTTTNDIAGGSSGSPAVNARGEVVGTIFDGNIHCLGGEYYYDGALNRAIAVSTAAVDEALRKVYAAGSLLEELNVE